MSDTCQTVKVVPSHPSQGDYVEINAADFDPEKHEKHEKYEKYEADPKLAELKVEADRLGVGYASDVTRESLAAKLADFHAMKAKKPSDGLKVDELKEALAAKGIAIPDGAKKPDLAALLDAAP
jgi:hypothetical protein